MSLQIRTSGFETRSLYRFSFPKEEKFPFLFLQAMKLRHSCKFLSYYKTKETYILIQDIFCGTLR